MLFLLFSFLNSLFTFSTSPNTQGNVVAKGHDFVILEQFTLKVLKKTIRNIENGILMAIYNTFPSSVLVL